MSTLYVDEIRPKTSGKHVLMPEKPVFFAQGAASGYQSFATSNTVIADWATSGSTYISQGGLTHSSGVVTVPVAGIYEVTGFVLVETDNAEYGLIMIYHGSTRVTLSQVYNHSAGGKVEHTAPVHAFINCAAGDTISMRQQASSTSVRWYNQGAYGAFGVKLVG